MSGAWTGGIDLINGGYEDAFAALGLYRERLCEARAGRGLGGSPALAPAISAEAARTIPEVDGAASELADFLAGEAQSVPRAGVLDRALACAQSLAEPAEAGRIAELRSRLRAP
ncbi:MAG: hypothetical protein MPI95_00050 [Nitrosopumilus sp.]|nr:hypothetical protein [Nitrosopumilus sp.]CAI9831388.1 hypothetical protein IBTHAUMO2_240106 [Nitrosopumilaceae archaeon]MDA7940876.1 hypothetical protein [Nitrosopumilus sp.]MDA7943268.1 hypothetical protein [Nitrosopumilus sp.]MDA7944239.1 hypothetical protein [Nitrosopumilus sp.]